MFQTYVLLRKNLLMFWRARAAVVITFLVPILLIYLFGHVFGLHRKEGGPSGIPLAVVLATDVPAAADLVEALQEERALRVITHSPSANGAAQPLTEAAVRSGLANNEFRYALILPSDMFSPSGLGVRLQFLTNPRNEIEAQMVDGLVQRAIFSRAPQFLGQALQQRAREYLGGERWEAFNSGLATTISSAFGGDPEHIRARIEAGDVLGAGRAANPPAADSTAAPPATASEKGDLFSRLLRLEREQVAGRDVKNPMAARLVGGYAIMFLLFAVSGSAAALFEEKDTGVFARLLSAPVTPAHILWSRFLFGLVLGLLQISALFFAGWLFYDIEIFAHAPALLAVTLSAAAACSAFGMLVAAFSPSAEVVSPLASLLVLSMCAIGGAWFPVSFMPDYIQSIAKLTLVYWAVEGFTDVLWAGLPLGQVLPKVGVLSGIAAGVMGVAIWRFNRNRMFE